MSARSFVALCALLLICIQASLAMPLKTGHPLFNRTEDGVYGVDVADPTSQSSFSCLASNGFSFAIVRGYHSYGAPDTNCPATVANAWAAGFAHVDVYMFPCYSCGNPAKQVNDMLNMLSSAGTQFGMAWLDIEGPGQYWSGDASSNQAFFEGLVSEMSANGVSFGIYSNEYEWTSIFGSSYAGGALYPLWYAHYDGNPSFGDFSPFGGWINPAIKQFNDNGGSCSASYDLNWYP